jgi:predicted phosphodiesterase
VRLLCISDIHGHADALGAVLAAAERHGYDKLLVAGDLCFPGPEPLETWRRLLGAGAICVQGVGDRALAMLDPGRLAAKSPHERARLARLAEARNELGDVILGRLSALPPTFRLPLDDGGELLLVHGSPLDPTEPLSHDMTDEEISALLGDDPADIVVCGGSHVPFDRTVSGVRVINLGSVGEAPRGSAPIVHADATLLDVGRRGAAWSRDEVLVERLVVPLGKAA